MLINRNTLINKSLDFIYLFIILIFIFGRSFVGLYIFGYRLGELIIAISLFASIFLFTSDNYKVFGKNIFYLQLLIWLSFLITLFFNKGSILNQYTFKASSYIWGISNLYLALYFFKYFEFTKLKLIFINLSLIYVYILSVVNYPEKIINFFLNYSDKWDFNKAATIALFFIITILLNNKILNLNRINFEYLVFVSFLFLPLFLFKSRGSFIAVLFFVVTQVYRYRKYIFIKDFRAFIVLIIALLILIFSTLTILNQGLETIFETNELQKSFSKLASQKETNIDSFFSFYFKEGKIYSIDGNINWRIQIWQDVLFDSINDKKLLLGNGYNLMIPAMNKYERQGDDGVNENVHNFIVNIFARGGIFQLLIFMLFYYNILFFRKQDSLNYEVISLCIPVFIIAFFDVSFENAHFPFLFYFFLSYFFNNKNNKL